MNEVTHANVLSHFDFMFSLSVDYEEGDYRLRILHFTHNLGTPDVFLLLCQ